MNQEEEKMIRFPRFGSNSYNQTTEGESKAKRRKRKSKGEAPVTGPKKRNLSAEQANFLEMNFGNERKLEAERKMRLATELGLDPKQVAVWFQNRRARWKSKKMEEEYTRLKRTHETLFLEKCSLEKEVLRLKDQLSEAEKEIMKLSEKAEGSRETGGGGSPSSPSFSMDVFHPAFPLGFSMEENENPFCMTETYLGPLWPSDSIIYV